MIHRTLLNSQNHLRRYHEPSHLGWARIAGHQPHYRDWDYNTLAALQHHIDVAFTCVRSSSVCNSRLTTLGIFNIP
jgi:hypothetical protein